MDLSFGARLRQQRERNGVALETIAEQTKVKRSLLEGLERDDVSHWPPGIFRRSYFRAYAQAIGLDPDSSVREFLELHPDRTGEIAPAPTEPPGGGGDSGSGRPPMRLRYLIDSAVGALPALRRQPGQRSGPAPRPLPATDVDAADEGRSSAVGETLVELTSGASVPASPPAAEEAAAVEGRPSRADVLDLSTLADLCTRLGRAADAHDVAPVLGDAVAMLDALGVILWIWDPRTSALSAVVAHGYSDEVLEQLPQVQADADNAIAIAFRASETRVVHGHDLATGAVVVPLMTPPGCAGVLALELWPESEPGEFVRASATILAAQLATLVGSPALAPPASG